MTVYVLVSVYRGLIEGAQAFSTTKKAEDMRARYLKGLGWDPEEMAMDDYMTNSDIDCKIFELQVDQEGAGEQL